VQYDEGRRRGAVGLRQQLRQDLVRRLLDVGRDAGRVGGDVV